MTEPLRRRLSLGGMVQFASVAINSPNLHRAGIYLVSALTSALIPFLLLPILARLLGPEGYGLVGAFTGLVTIATVLVGVSTHGILTTVYFRVDEAEFHRKLAACMWVALCSAPVLWVVSVSAARWLEPATGIPAKWYWALIGAALGQFFLSAALAVAQVRSRALQFAALQIGNSALNLSLTIALVALLTHGWEGRALAQCIATLLVGVCGLLWIGGRDGLPLKTDRRSMAQVLGFGIPLVPHSLAAAVMASADRLILIALIGAATAGQYFAAFQIAAVTSLTSLAINQAMTPWLFKSLANRSDEGDRRIVRLSYLIMAALVAQGVAVALLAGPLVWLAGGSGFEQAVPLVRILAISMTFNGAYYLFANYIFYAHKTHWLSALTLSVSVFQVVAAIAMVHLFGAKGAAWASVATNALYFLGVWVVAARLIPMPWLSALRAPA